MWRWCCWGLLPGILVAQGLPETRQWVLVTARDSVICLGVPFVQALEIRLDSLYTLQSPLDYELAAREGCVQLSAHFRRLFRVRDTLRLFLSARYVPLFVQPRGGGRREQGSENVSVVRAEQKQASEPPAAPPLQPRGRLIRGFSLQTGSGIQFHSGLELGVSARVAEQTEVGGRIAAERLPVTLAGTTISLQELDQFALQVRSPGFQAEVGELVLPQVLQEELGSGQLQGVRAAARVGQWEVSTVLGASRAATVVTVLSARDGVPGPYRLQDALGRRISAVLPGSERVWVDGVLQERGEDRDYVFDYLRGELTFRPRRPVSSASRIVVEFSALNQESAQTLALLRLSGAVGGGHTLSVGSLYRLTMPLQDVPSAVRPVFHNGMAYGQADGASWVGFDSTTGRGHGWYRRRDTLIGGERCAIWEYAPAAPDAFYMVEFSAVGTGRGDYVQEAPGVFRYVGAGRGAYAPVRLLPLPARQQLWDIGWEWQTSQWVSHLRWSGSRVVLPQHHPSAFHGMALSLNTLYRSDADTVRCPLLWESQTLWHSPFFFGRRTEEEQRVLVWNFVRRELDDGSAQAFHQQRLQLRLAPVVAEALAGWMRWGSGMGVLWGGMTLGVLSEQQSPALLLRYAGGQSTDDGAGQRFLWQRIGATAMVVASPWRLLAHLWGQWQRGDHALSGYRQRDIVGEMLGSWVLLPRVTLEASLVWRQQWEPLRSRWWQPSLWLRWGQPEQWTLQLRLGWNRVQQGGQSWQGPQALWQGRVPLPGQGSVQWRYEVGTELTDTLALTFVRVVPGQGAYRYRGDLNGNGLADPSEFEPAPVGGDYVSVPTSFGISRPGSFLRAEGVVRLPLAGQSEMQREWESRFSVAQRGVMRSGWRSLLPQRATEVGVSMTQWIVFHRLRFPTGTVQWDARAEWAGTAFWLGTAWEQGQRATGELRWECRVQNRFQLVWGGGPLWEERRRAFQPGWLRLSAARLFAETPWQLSSVMGLTPQLQLLRGAFWSDAVLQRVVNVVGALRANVQQQDFLSAEGVLQFGMLAPELPSGLLLWVGSLLSGWRLQGSVGYRTGNALWSLQYLGAQQKRQRWWHALNGQVQLNL